MYTALTVYTYVPAAFGESERELKGNRRGAHTLSARHSGKSAAGLCSLLGRPLVAKVLPEKAVFRQFLFFYKESGRTKNILK